MNGNKLMITCANKLLNIIYSVMKNNMDFKDPELVDRMVIDELMTLRFIHNTENVVFLGPPGSIEYAMFCNCC